MKKKFVSCNKTNMYEKMFAETNVIFLISNTDPSHSPRILTIAKHFGEDFDSNSAVIVDFVFLSLLVDGIKVCQDDVRPSCRHLKQTESRIHITALVS